MKRIIVFSLFISLFTVTGFAQKFYTKTGKISFDATTSGSPEKIEGVNRTSTCVIDAQNGNMQFAVLMKGFEFERALMEEHFNENYVESHKFPKAEFKGAITNNAAVNYTKDGTYPVKVKGKLTIHGETKEVETSGTVTVAGGKVSAKADFPVTLADFKVSIPGLVADKVAKVARIKVECALELLKS